MTTAKVLKSGKSNVLELPESAAFPEFVEEVSVVAIGNTRIISPVDESWDYWFDNPLVTGDFMRDRLQVEGQVRPAFEKNDSGKAVYLDHEEAKSNMADRIAKIRSQD